MTRAERKLGAKTFRAHVLVAALLGVASPTVVEVTTANAEEKYQNSGQLTPACRADQHGIAVRDGGIGIEWGLKYSCFGLVQRTDHRVRTYENGVQRGSMTWQDNVNDQGGTKSQYVNLANRNPSRAVTVKVVWDYENGMQEGQYSIERQIWYDPE